MDLFGAPPTSATAPVTQQGAIKPSDDLFGLGEPTPAAQAPNPFGAPVASNNPFAPAAPAGAGPAGGSPWGSPAVGGKIGGRIDVVI